jgi:hypothetical protein
VAVMSKARHRGAVTNYVVVAGELPRHGHHFHFHYVCLAIVGIGKGIPRLPLPDATCRGVEALFLKPPYVVF